MHLIASSTARRVVPGAPPREGLVLSLTDDEGHKGYGEATPLIGYSPDDALACERALQAIHERIDEIPEDIDAAPAITAALAPLELGPVPAARFAIESALTDLLGQRLGLSIAEILGDERPYTRVPVNGLLLACSDAADLVRRAQLLADRGLSALKIKLRARDDDAFARELDALTNLRRELPPPFELRLDANGAWDLDLARRRLGALAPLEPSYVEQPAPLEALHLLGRCDVPWAADESLQRPDLADRLLECEGCVAFILKPSTLGLLGAYDLALRAQFRGLGVVVTHLFDGPVAFAAACELALALPRIPLACGLDAHDGLGAQPEAWIPQLSAAGFVTATEKHGLGLASPDPPAPPPISRRNLGTSIPPRSR